MSVYISGLKIPQDGRVTLQIDSNGGVYVVNKFSIASEKYEKSMAATEIQPHGRLGDLDKLMTEFMDSDLDHLQRDDWREVIQIVADAPTVIEAEGETDA